MKIKLIFLIIPILLFFSSCRAEEDKTDTENGKETLIMAYPSEVEDYYFNRFQQSESNELIAMFNQKSEDFIIQKQEYESYDKLLIDILSGRSFDLLYVGDWLDMTSMYNKGILCDLNELIDADDEISRDIYVEPVLDALEVNGKLYQIPCDFAVETAVVNADTWDGDTDQSIAHLCEKAEQLGYEIPFDLSLDSFSFSYIVSSEFIDLDNGVCNFTDGRFEELLVMMKKFTDYCKNETINYPNGATDLFSENKVMIMSFCFTGFDQLSYETADVVGVKLKYVGLPSDIPNYHIAVPIASFSIFDDSENKKGAFEFIKFYTAYNTYIYDAPTASGAVNRSSGMPINKAVVEYYAEDTLSEINKLFYSELGDEMREEYRDATLEHIYSINGAGNHIGSGIKNILTEEIPYYLSGSKSASEVCEMIQNRVSTYIAEKS